MKRTSKLKALKQYRYDPSILDVKPDFDKDLSQPLFHQGNEVGCITLHGIGGTPANIRVVADRLIQCGYTVVSPTLPGHGTTVRGLNASTGEEWLNCVLTAYDRLKDAGCKQIYVLGLSLGGILSALTATQRPVDGLVMICAPIQVQPFLRMARRISNAIPFVSYPEDADNPNTWRKNPYAQMYDGFSTKKLVDLDRLCRQLRGDLGKITCPVMMVNAKYDDKVDASSVDIWKAGAVNVPSTEYVYLEHSPHGCTYGPERELVAEKAAAFVERLVKEKQQV